MNESRLADHALQIAQSAMQRQRGPSGYGGVQPPWTDRSTATHTHLGQEWAVVVDWAERPDGVRVAASVTLSSLGGTLADEPAPGATPEAVTRALVESVPWGTLLWEQREAVRLALPGQPRATAYDAPTNHDETLREVARLYVELGGEGNRTIVQDVRDALEALGITVKPRKNNPEGILTRERVRDWIKECRSRKPGERGYLSPSSRSSRSPKTS